MKLIYSECYELGDVSVLNARDIIAYTVMDNDLMNVETLTDSLTTDVETLADLLTVDVESVADLLWVNEETVRRWIRSGKLKARIESKKQGYKISLTNLYDFLDENERAAKRYMKMQRNTIESLMKEES